MARVAVYSEIAHGINVIREYIAEANMVYGLNIQVDYYDSANILAWDMELSCVYDLVIIYRDWRMAGILRKKFRNVNMMMVSLGLSRGIYDIQPCYQVYEPMNKSDFMRVFMAAVSGIEKSACFVFQSGWVKYRLNIHEIMYFESDRRVINIKSLYGDYSFYGNMKQLAEQTKSLYTGFVRVHSSFIVNMEYVRRYNSRQLVLLDGTKIVISDRWRQEVTEGCDTLEVASIRHISTVLY